MTAEASRPAAPIDRPAGRRGWRGALAGLAAIAIVPCVGAATAYETGGWGSGHTSVDYRLDGPGWTHTALIVAAIGLAASAVLIWIARRPVWLHPRTGAGAAGRRRRRVDCGQALPVRTGRGRPDARCEIGASRPEVRRRFGLPAGHATLTRSGRRRSCDLYRSKGEDRSGFRREFVLCFGDGRLIDRTEW